MTSWTHHFPPSDSAWVAIVSDGDGDDKGVELVTLVCWACSDSSKDPVPVVFFRAGFCDARELPGFVGLLPEDIAIGKFFDDDDDDDDDDDS